MQNAITIRHSDAVDVKFYLMEGEDRIEKVVSLPHPALLELSHRTDRPLTDPWVMKLAALHVKRMIETDEDMEKVIVTPSIDELEQYNSSLEKAQEALSVHR